MYSCSEVLYRELLRLSSYLSHTWRKREIAACPRATLLGWGLSTFSITHTNTLIRIMQIRSKDGEGIHSIGQMRQCQRRAHWWGLTENARAIQSNSPMKYDNPKTLRQINGSQVIFDHITCNVYVSGRNWRTCDWLELLFAPLRFYRYLPKLRRGEWRELGRGRNGDNFSIWNCRPVSESVGQTNRRNHLFFAYLHTEAVCAHHCQTASFSGRQLQRYRGGVKK